MTSTMEAGSFRVIDGPMGPFYVPIGTLMANPDLYGTIDEMSRICEGLSRAVWAGEYDHPELPAAGAPIKTILDIGAGWGAFAVWATKRWGSDIVIDGYEPHEEAREYLAKNAPTVIHHPGAVTTEDNVVLAINDDWGACSVYKVTNGRPVPSIHPNTLPAVDLLKIDAEGVEPEIIANYQHLSTLKALIYEFHSLDHKALLRDMCSKAGMRQIREDQEGTYGTSIWLPN